MQSLPRSDRAAALLVLAAPLALGALAACGGPRPAPGEPPASRGSAPAAERRGAQAREAADPEAAPAEPLPWTEAFRKESLLLARVIEVEGPPGLLGRAVLRQEPHLEYRVETLPEGLLQELSAPPGARVELRGQLDNWTLVAEERLLLLERPAEVPVRVRARGAAVWREVPSGAERRGETLEFAGRRPAPSEGARRE